MGEGEHWSHTLLLVTSTQGILNAVVVSRSLTDALTLCSGVVDETGRNFILCTKEGRLNTVSL